MAEAGVDFPLVARERGGGAAAGRELRRRLLRPRWDDLRRPVPDGSGGGAAAAAGRAARVLARTPLAIVCWHRRGRLDRPGAARAVLRDAPLGRRSRAEPVEFNLPHGEWIQLFRENGFEIEALIEVQPPRRSGVDVSHGVTERVGAAWPMEEIWKARKRGVSVPPAPPLLLASTLAAAPRDPRAARHSVRRRRPALRGARSAGRGSRRARARARARARRARSRRGRRPAGARRRHDGRLRRTRSRQAGAAARTRPRCSTRSAGATHEVVSGLCLVTPAWEELDHEVTRVTFRPLTARDIAAYVASGEWRGPRRRVRDPGPAAPRLVERIEGDYLNVVGLPARCSSACSPRASRALTASAERMRSHAG